MKNIIFILLLIFTSFFVDDISAQDIDPNNINYENVKDADRAKLSKYFLAGHSCNKRGDLKGFSKNLNSIANLYWKSKNYQQAIKYFDISLEVNIKLKNDNAVAGISNFKGMIYADSKQYDKSIENFKKALASYKLRRRREDIISTYLNMSLSYKNMPNMQKTIECTEAAFKTAQELNDVPRIVDCAGILASYYNELKNTEKSEFYFNIYQAFNETKDKELKNSLRVLKLKNALNESEKKSKELELYKNKQQLLLKDKIIIEKDSIYSKLAKKYSEGQIITKLYEETIKQKEVIIAKDRRFLRVITIVLVFITFLLVIIVYFFFRSRKLNKLLTKSYKELKEINEILITQKAEITMHKEEIEAQRDELVIQRNRVVKQRDKIIWQNTQINDSMVYARKIQEAVFQSNDAIQNMVSDYFVLLMPRDIVSGDFYWLGKSGDKNIIVAADCTGHGVPGAFMSLLGSLLLEEVVNREQINHPAAILNRLREKIKYLLNQTGKYDEAKDGMDVALITIDTKDNTLEFAGAYNPLFIYRDKKLEVIKGDRMPIGIHAKEHDFTNHTMQLQKDDRLYLFSDGYPDQMGGSKSRKFMMFRFKEMIIDNAEKDMSEQRQIYLNTIQEWMNHESEEFGDHHDQIDDILLIGMKI